MKYTERPLWMAPSRRKSPEPAKPVSMSLVPEGPPPEASAPPGPHNGGYNPYDTVKTRTADLWRFKPKRS